MKKAKKVIQIVILLVVIVILLIVFGFWMFGAKAIKTGVETAASKTLGVGVSIDNIDLSIFGGAVAMDQLIVKNPEGYEHENLLELGSAKVQAKLMSFLSDTVRINDIKLDTITLVIEQKGLTNNLQQILKALPKPEDKPAETETQQQGKDLHIDNLEISNVTVKLKLLDVIPGKADTITLKLAPIQMTDIGSDTKVDIAGLTAKIFTAIAKGIAEQGAGVFPDDVLGSLQAGLGKTLEMGTEALSEAEKILEQSKDAGEGVLKGIKGIFDSKKDEDK